MPDTTDAITLEVLDAPKRDRKVPNDYPIERQYVRTRDVDGWEHFSWQVRLTFEGRTIDTPWKAGTGHDPSKAPKAEDVLSSLMLDASSYFNSNGFEDWASEFGYDADSRKAEALWNTIGELARQLVGFLGSQWGATDSVDAEEAAAELVKYGRIGVQS